MNIIIFGPPGAGKGTQSKFLVSKYKLYQLSTGDLLRNEIKNKSELGLKISSIINTGGLVSDEIVGNLIEKFVSNETYKNNIIFDGYPRTLFQAKNLNELLKRYDQKIDIVLKLSVNFETIKKRIMERQIQEKRSDDNEETAIKRFETYEQSTKPILEYYKKQNLIKEVNGEQKIEQINKEIGEIIELIEGWLWPISPYKYAFIKLTYFIWLVLQG